MKKKIFTAVLVVLSTLMLSSCIIVDWDDWFEDYQDYDGEYRITMYNDSSYRVRDWYVIDSHGYKYYPKNREISRDRSASINGLDSGYYKIRFKLGSYDYETSSSFSLNRNRTYNVTDYKDYDTLYNIKQTELPEAANQ